MNWRLPPASVNERYNRYFPSKEAIISATLDVFMQEMQRFFQTC
jgi:hypothetical protein